MVILLAIFVSSVQMSFQILSTESSRPDRTKLDLVRLAYYRYPNQLIIKPSLHPGKWIIFHVTYQSTARYPIKNKGLSPIKLWYQVILLAYTEVSYDYCSQAVLNPHFLYKWIKTIIKIYLCYNVLIFNIMLFSFEICH